MIRRAIRQAIRNRWRAGAAAASGTSTGRGRAAAGYRKEAANPEGAADGAELAAEGLPILTGGKYQGKGLRGRRGAAAIRQRAAADARRSGRRSGRGNFDRFADITELLNPVNENEKNAEKDRGKGGIFDGQVKNGRKPTPDLTKSGKNGLFNYS